MLTFLQRQLPYGDGQPRNALDPGRGEGEGHETVEVENLHRAIRLIQKGAVV